MATKPKLAFFKAALNQMEKIFLSTLVSRLYLQVHTFHQESLRAGDLLVFDGDCVHAGSAYTTTNTRVHCYLDSCTHARKVNQTWLF